MAKDKDYQPPPSWAELLGDEDLSVYQPQDQPAPPGPRSSAMRIDRDQREAAREARRQQHRDVIEAAGKLEDDRDAYDRVMENRRTRRPSSPADQAAAARYALAQGIVQPKTLVQRQLDAKERSS
jgi:hypothetical protein